MEMKGNTDSSPRLRYKFCWHDPSIDAQLDPTALLLEFASSLSYHSSNSILFLAPRLSLATSCRTEVPNVCWHPRYQISILSPFFTPRSKCILPVPLLTPPVYFFLLLAATRQLPNTISESIFVLLKIGFSLVRRGYEVLQLPPQGLSRQH
jgi:hypothetical protein